MELIRKLAFIGAFAGAVAAKLVADEIKAQIPPLAKRIARIAAARLPIALRERFANRWQKIIDETPGEFRKLFAALCFIKQTRNMRRWKAIPPTSKPANRVRYAGFIFAVLALILSPFQITPSAEVENQSPLATLIGSGFVIYAIAGIGHATRHSDDPASNPLGPSLGKWGAGAAFLRAPAAVDMLRSIGNQVEGGGAGTFTGIGNTSNL